MLRLVLREYQCRFFMLLKAYMGKIILYIWWMYIYTMIICEEDLDILKYSMGMVPMLAGLLLSRMYPNHLNKLLFLCPMTEKDRKKYLKTAYGVRTGVAILLYLLLSLLTRMIEDISWFEYLAASLLVFSFVLGANMYHALFSLKIVWQKEEKNYRLSFAYGFFSLSAQIIA